MSGRLLFRRCSSSTGDRFITGLRYMVLGFLRAPVKTKFVINLVLSFGIPIAGALKLRILQIFSGGVDSELLTRLSS